MNQATKIASQFMLWQMDGLALMCDEILSPEVWTISRVRFYYEDVCDDFPENYDEDYYSIFYLDKRSPCIDWAAVTEAVQEERDELFIELLFE